MYLRAAYSGIPAGALPDEITKNESDMDALSHEISSSDDKGIDKMHPTSEEKLKLAPTEPVVGKQLID